MIFWTAIAVGFIHTLVGPDHYVPFIVIGRARRWGLARTSLLTFVCGVGHVLSSIVIGLVGVAVGAALTRVQWWESTRGQWAGWAMLGFGALYGAWGVWRALRGHAHRHLHLHRDGSVHAHDHTHDGGHPSVHEHAGRPDDAAAPLSWRSLTPWVLFVIFVLGPCEPLVPLFFASALQGSWSRVALVALGYGLATLVAMHAIVAACWFGLKRLDFGRAERWSHALAGGVILLSGAAMSLLGL